MNENHTVHLADVPIGALAGSIWNRLHGDREEICESLLKDGEPVYQADGHRDVLQARLRKIDDALDRLMSGSYGVCSKCGRSIEKATLDIDPAWALCLDCSNEEPRGSWSRAERDSCSEVMIECLNPFDTILLRTQNSRYRVLLLDPKTGRALVEGGALFAEPREGLLMGSALPGSEFQSGMICVGCRLEIWSNDKIFLTSVIKSIGVKQNPCAESAQSIAAALH